MITLLNNGNIVYRVPIAHIQSPPDHFHLAITSQLLTAKDPNALQTCFSVTLSRDELTKLRSIINLALSSPP